MRNVSIIVLALIPASLIACKKSEEEPPPQSGYQPQPGYPQQQPTQPGYQQQPTQPGYQTAPAPTTPAPAPGAPGAAPLSTPDATAFPCQSDAQCVTHRCNTQFQKCAYPCRADTDCAPGNRCMTPLCVPGTTPPAQ